MKLRLMTTLAFCAVAMVGLMGNDCSNAPPAPTVKMDQAKKAAEAANSLHFTENAEIDNIKRRLQLTAQPGLLGYIAIINKVGQVVMYTPVRGKVTSGGKRLTAPWIRITCDKGANSGDCFVAGPSDEGTYGSSADYLYFWTENDQFIQTDLGYVYSDKPFRLTTEPLISLAGLSPSK